MIESKLNCSFYAWCALWGSHGVINARFFRGGEQGILRCIEQLGIYKCLQGGSEGISYFRTEHAFALHLNGEMKKPPN